MLEEEWSNSWEPEGRYHYWKMFRWEPEGAIAMEIVQRERPSGSQRNSYEYLIAPFWHSTDDILSASFFQIWLRSVCQSLTLKHHAKFMQTFPEPYKQYIIPSNFLILKKQIRHTTHGGKHTWCLHNHANKNIGCSEITKILNEYNGLYKINIMFSCLHIPRYVCHC